MIEYFPEPVERKPFAHCSECGEPLFERDMVANIKDGYICKKCWTETSLGKAPRKDFIEFIKMKDLEKEFGEWFYEPEITFLGES